MISKEFTVQAENGFHLRPAQALMEAITPFASEVTIKTPDGGEANAKSLLNLMTLGADKGQTLTVEVDGPDEQAVMNTIQKLFDENFGE